MKYICSQCKRNVKIKNENGFLIEEDNFHSAIDELGAVCSGKFAVLRRSKKYKENDRDDHANNDQFDYPNNNAFNTKCVPLTFADLIKKKDQQLLQSYRK